MNKTTQTMKAAILLTLMVFYFASTVAMAQGREKKTIFIIVDGIPADVVERVPTPNIDAIAQKGKYLRIHVGGDKDSYSQTPTISAVGYNSLLTGTWVNKHNVWDNDIKEPNYHYWNIFRLLKNQYPNKKTAIFSSWLDNRTKLIGEGIKEAGSIQVDYHLDSLEYDTVQFPHDMQHAYMQQIDEKVTEAAAACIRNKAPDLSWVYLEYTDDMGHLYGDSKQFYNAVELMDAQIGRIWNTIQYRKKQFKEDWLLIITTDHGRDAKTGRDHGGQSPRERTTWMVTNYPALNKYAQYYQPAIIDIMPTIARFMDIHLEKQKEREIDGIPLIGPVSLVLPQVNYIQGNLDISWKAINKNGKVKVWVATTNNYKSGIADDYKLMAEVPISDEHVFIDATQLKSSFYKVVLEGPYNTVNRWITIKEE